LTILSIIICYIIDSNRKNYIRSIFKQDGQIYHPDVIQLEEYILYLTKNYNKTVLKTEFLKNLGKKLIIIKDDKSELNDSIDVVNEMKEKENPKEDIIQHNKSKSMSKQIAKEFGNNIESQNSNQLENANRSDGLLKSNKFKFFKKETIMSKIKSKSNF
jgi:hypothetical protein